MAFREGRIETTAYSELPDDDTLAFLELESEFRNEFERNTQVEDSAWQYHGSIYINKTLAAADELAIAGFEKFEDSTSNDGNFSVLLNHFQRAVETLVVRMRIRQSRRAREMSVGLGSPQKTKIHSFIEKIRSEVENSAASVPKKEKLYLNLAKLAEEVSKNRAGLERFGDLARGLSTISRDFAQDGAEPWWKWFAAIMGIVDDAKEAEPQLPKPSEVKRIEAPKKELPRPDVTIEDDEIPF